MQNHSYENDFDLQEKETASRTHFHMKCFAQVKTHFEREAQENSEMAGWLTHHRSHSFAKLK